MTKHEITMRKWQLLTKQLKMSQRRCKTILIISAINCKKRFNRKGLKGKKRPKKCVKPVIVFKKI